MRLRLLVITALVIVLIALPVGIAVWKQGEVRHWSSARWDSAGLAPDPRTTPEAVIQVYCAASWGLKGAVADHCWIAFKPERAAGYTRYDVVAWGVRSGGEAIRVNFRGVPDGNWAGNRPRVLLDRRGPAAQALIDDIEQAVQDYPYRHTYRTWPGPNSNTFMGWIARQVPELGLDLPPRAIGKDFIGNSVFAACTQQYRLPAVPGRRLEPHRRSGRGSRAQPLGHHARHQSLRSRDHAARPRPTPAFRRLTDARCSAIAAHRQW